MKLSLYDKALSEVSKLLLTLSDKSDPSSLSNLFNTYYLRGKLHYLLSDFKTALINLNNAQLLNEASNKVYLLKAMCYLSLGNLKKAKEEMESVGITNNGALGEKEIGKMRKMVRQN